MNHWQAGLDPITSYLLDELILDMRDSLGTALVLVSLEFASISLELTPTGSFLDGDSHSTIAGADPKRFG